MSIRLALAATSALLAFTNSNAQQDADGWQFQLTPYLWLPTIGGDLNFSPPPGGGGAPVIDVGPTDWLELLNGAVLLNGGVRKGQYSLTADIVYLGLESNKDHINAVRDGTVIPVDASLNVATKTNFDGVSWTLAAGYALQDSEKSFMEVIGGVRYFGVDVRIRWNLELDVTAPGGSVVLPAQGSLEEKVDLWDAIIGIRGNVKLGDGKWSVPYYADVGTGSSDRTWQALAGISYAYNWGELMLAYRHLAYDEGSDGILQDFSFSGPGLGARFRF